jgi:hypothetical protein
MANLQKQLNQNRDTDKLSIGVPEFVMMGA